MNNFYTRCINRPFLYRKRNNEAQERSQNTVLIFKTLASFLSLQIIKALPQGTVAKKNVMEIQLENFILQELDYCSC